MQSEYPNPDTLSKIKPAKKLQHHNMENYFKNVLFIGPNKHLRGGIASVLEVYSQTITPFNFLSSYNGKGHLSNFFYFIAVLFKLPYRLVTDKNIKIVHLHTASKGSFMRKSILVMVTKIFGKKAVLHFHASDFKDFYKGIGPFTFYVRFIMKISDEVICLSDEWKEYYDSLISDKKEKSIILHNPAVLPASIKPHTLGHPIEILYMNRISTKKGIFDLLNCFKQYKNELEGSFRLIVAGAGEETDEVLKFIKNNGLNEMIEYRGWVIGKEKDAMIEHCDVFILPSYNEGLPMAILESMSYGKPVISTPVGGVPRVIKPGINGWLHDSGNITQLKTIFDEIKANPAILAQYGAKGTEIVVDYTPEKVNKKLLEIYDDMLK